MEIKKELKEKLEKEAGKARRLEDNDLEAVAGGIAVRKPDEKILPVLPREPKIDK